MFYNKHSECNENIKIFEETILYLTKCKQILEYDIFSTYKLSENINTLQQKISYFHKEIIRIEKEIQIICY